jgi:hypothetical protein
MSKIIANGREFEFKILPREIHAIDNKYFFESGHQIRILLRLNFVRGLGDMSELNKPISVSSRWQLRLLDGSIASLSNQWELINKSYRVKVLGGKWDGGIINGKINNSEYYTIDCKGSGICTLTICKVGTAGLGRQTHIIDLREFETFDFKELTVKIKGKESGNTLLETLKDMKQFLLENPCDKFMFIP